MYEKLTREGLGMNQRGLLSVQLLMLYLFDILCRSVFKARTFWGDAVRLYQGA